MSTEIAWMRAFPSAPKWGALGKLLYHGIMKGDDIVVSSSQVPSVFGVGGALFLDDGGRSRACAAGFSPQMFRSHTIKWSCQMPWQGWSHGDIQRYAPHEPESIFGSKAWPIVRANVNVWRLVPSANIDLYYEIMSDSMLVPDYDYALVAGSGLDCVTGIMQYPVGDPGAFALLSVNAWSWLLAEADAWFRADAIWLGPCKGRS